jgi:hypothetical protein
MIGLGWESWSIRRRESREQIGIGLGEGGVALDISHGERVVEEGRVGEIERANCCEVAISCCQQGIDLFSLRKK